MPGDEWQPNRDVRTGQAPAAVAPRHGRASVRGVAYDVMARSEYGQGGSVQVMSFRVDSFDAHGDRYVPVPVELRGYALRGYVGNGHEVEVDGEYDDGTLRAQRVRNLTTGATVEAKDVPRWAKRAILAFVLGFILLAFALVAGGILLFADQVRDFPGLGGGGEIDAPFPGR